MGKTPTQHAEAAAAFLTAMRRAGKLKNSCYDCGAAGMLRHECRHRSAVLHFFGASAQAVKALLAQGV
jgi:hypothetical protein